MYSVKRGKLTYDGDLSNPDISIDHIEGKLSMFKAAPDMYRALIDIFTEFDDELDYMLGTDMTNRVKSVLKKARGE